VRLRPTYRVLCLLYFTPPPTPALHPLSLHDALPISRRARRTALGARGRGGQRTRERALRARGGRCRRRAHLERHGDARLAPEVRSEEHTSELQSRENLVCRLLLEKKKQITTRERPLL